MIHPEYIHQRTLTITDKIRMTISAWNKEDRSMKRMALSIGFLLITIGIFLSISIQFLHPFLIFASATLYFFYKKFPVAKEHISGTNSWEVTIASYHDPSNFFLKVVIVQVLYIVLFLFVQYSGYFDFLALTQQDNTLLNEINNVGFWILFPFVLFGRYRKRVKDLKKLKQDLV